MQLPDEVPVMVLPGSSLFPHAMLPLFIFEPRYRAMLQTALETDRMFCIAMVRPEVEEWVNSDDFHHVAGVGLVRACVGREDGSSNLVLQGLARVRFRGFTRTDPYYVARIEEIPSIPAEPPAADALAAKARELCQRFKERDLELPAQLEQYLAQIHEPGVLADVIANTFVGNAMERQRLLEQAEEGRRLRLLIKCLRRELND